MAELTPLEKAEMGRDFKRNYDLLKIQGSMLVNKGEITQQEYYDKMRSKAIEYGVIREDEYPGALPGGLEDFLRVSGNVVGGILGRNNPVAVGAGGAAGQAIFDTANTFYTNYVRPGVQTKPLDQITEDTAKAFAFDAVATKAFDSAIKGGQKAITGIKTKMGTMTDEQLRKAHKKVKDSETVNATTEELRRAKIVQEESIEELVATLEKEGIDATRYAAYGASSLSEFIKGIADVIGVIPGLSIPAKEAYKKGLRQVFDSATKGTAVRPAIFQKDAFKITPDGRDIIRNEALSDAFYQNLPLTLIRQVQKQAASRATTISNAYKAVDDDLLDLSNKFGKSANFNKHGLVDVVEEGTDRVVKTSLSREALALNEKLKQAAPENIDASGQFSKFLPKELRELIPSKSKEFKLSGLQAGLVSPSFKNELTPKQLRNLDTQLRNIIDASRVYTAQGVPIPSGIAGRDVSKIRKVIRSLIKEKDKKFGTNISGKKLEADTAFVRRDNFLKNNNGIFSFINMQNRKFQDAVDFDDFINKVNADQLGIKVNQVGGIRIAGQDVLPNKELSAPEMLNTYLGSEKGVATLSKLMNVTDEAGNVVSSTPEFRRLVFNEIETIFDDTLFASVRERGRFETSALRERLGFVGKEAIETYAKFDRMLKDAAKGQENFITMKDLDKFTRYLDRLQPDPQVRKFLMRRVALASSQSLSLGSILPTLTAGGGVVGGAVLGGLPALGLMFLFQRFMSGKYGRGEFAKVTSLETMRDFFGKMYESGKNIADNINNKILGGLGKAGIRTGDVLKFSVIDNLGQNMEILSDAQNAQDYFGNPNENPEELIRELKR